MTNRGFTSVVLIAAVLAGSVAHAQAQSRFLPPGIFSGSQYSAQDRRQNVVGPDGQICVRMCIYDDLPCDPISYKLADGRCRNERH